MKKTGQNRNNIFKFNRQTFCAQKTLFGVGEYDSYLQLNLEEALATTACEIVVLWPRFFLPACVSQSLFNFFNSLKKRWISYDIIIMCLFENI